MVMEVSQQGLDKHVPQNRLPRTLYCYPITSQTNFLVCTHLVKLVTKTVPSFFFISAPLLHGCATDPASGLPCSAAVVVGWKRFVSLIRHF